MKLSLSRALAIAAALALSIPAFAQVTINGYYRVGSMSNLPSSGSATTAFQDRVRLNLSFAAPDDMFGFKARLQADSSVINGANYSGLANLFLDGFSGTVDTTAAASKTAKVSATVTPPGIIKYGYGYAKLLDGAIKLSAGYLDLTDYAVVQNTGNYYFGNVMSDDVSGPASPNLSGQKGKFLGTALQAWPIEGLSVAATMRTDGTTLAAHHLGFDAYYFIPGFGKALLASQLGSYTDAATSSDDLSKSYVSGGFSYLGFKGLTATAVLRSTYASSKAALGTVAIVEYATGPLFADLATDIDFTNSHYYVEGEVTYTVDPKFLKVRAYGAYNDVVTSNIKINGTSNQQSLGADLVFPIGKGEIQAGVVYGDKSNIQFPVLVKANF
jgi:hypothetical protein